MDTSCRDMQELLKTELPHKIKMLEARMWCHLSESLYPGHRKWPSFCTYLQSLAPVPDDVEQKGILEIKNELYAKRHISPGRYDILKDCLELMPDLRRIVETCENNMKAEWSKHLANLSGGPQADTEHSNRTHHDTSTEADEDIAGKIAINVYQRSVYSKEGEHAVLRCSVNPQASSIIWKKGKPKPEEPIFVDNMKYIAGNPLSPPLVITNTDKISDESNYSLTATKNDTRTRKESGIIALYVDAEGLDNYQAQSTPNMSPKNVRKVFRKRRNSEDCSESLFAQRPRADNDVNVAFPIEKDIDTTRQKSKEDIQQTLENHVQEPGRDRIKSVEFIEQCILVSVDIKGATSPTETSALCIAERIKSFLREGEIRLTDKDKTRLKIKAEEIKITIKNEASDGYPIVSLSQTEYYAEEMTTLVMHCAVLACSPVTAVRWVRIRYGEEEELDIDNDKYLGGGILSPSLVITDFDCTDEGFYRCYVTSSEGEGKSDTAWLETNSDYTDLSIFLHQKGHKYVDSSAINSIKSYLASNKLPAEHMFLLGIAIYYNSRNLLQHILTTEPKILSSRDVNGCDALHHCCQYGTLSMFKLLLDSGMSAGSKTSNGSTCLMMATLNKNSQILQYLLENFPEQVKDANSDGKDCLLMSCEKDNIHVFELLVRNGISLKHKDKAGNTCLMTAIAYRNNFLARFIVENYPKQLNDNESDCLDALMLCCKVGNIDMFKFMFVNWIGSDPIFDKGMTCLMVAVMHKQKTLAKYIAAVLPDQVNIRNDDGLDALMFCCMYGDVELFDFLINQGMNASSQTREGLTCLMSAVRNKQQAITEHIINLYPEQLRHQDRNGWNALHHCSYSGNVSIFHYLLENGMKPETCTNDGSTCLLIAILHKHFDLVRQIVSLYPEQMNKQYQNGWNALFYCCEAGDVDIFEYLVEKGLDFGKSLADGSTCLMVATLNKHFDLIRHIVDKDQEQLNRRHESGWDVLLHCCKAGDVRIFDYIVEKGAEPKTCSNDGSTCLMIAAANKHFNLVWHIVDKFPEILDNRDNNSWNALHYCCQAGDVAIFDFLVTKGTTVDSSSTCLKIALLNQHFEMCRHILEKYTEPEHRYRDGCDVLLCCCQSGDVRIFDYLVEIGLNPDTRTTNGSTCLMIAVLNRNFDVTQHIVDKYPEQLEQRDKNGFDALLFCCQSGDVRTFDYLVERGKKPDTRTTNGSTCLMNAVIKGHFDLTQHIVDKYPEQLQHRDKDGYDVLLWCCEGGDVRTFDYLVKRGLKPSNRTANGSTCLMIAVLNGHFDLARHIVDKYAKLLLEQRNKKGFDALLCCCQSGDVRTFDYLVERGLKPDTRTTNGSTCLMIAASNRHFDLTQYIVDKYPEQLKLRDKNGFDVLLCCCQSGDVRTFDYLVERGLKPDTRTADGSTCLMMAVLNRNFDLTKHIVGKCPEQLKQRDKNGCDVLLCCCQSGDVRTFDYLIERGLKPDTRTTNGSTCLVIAVLNCHIGLTKYIVDKYPEQLKLRNKNGFDALLMCCQGGDVITFDYLVERGLKPDTRTADGLTYLMIAVLNRNFDITQHIIDKYPEQLEQRDKNGCDVLLYCCQTGDIRTFDYLVERGLNPYTLTADGSTYLMIAVLNRNFDLTKHIVGKYPEQLEQRNKNGFDALHWCHEGGDVRIFDYLVERGLKPDKRYSDGATCLKVDAKSSVFARIQSILNLHPDQLKQRDKNCDIYGVDRILNYFIGKGLKRDRNYSNDDIFFFSSPARGVHRPSIVRSLLSALFPFGDLFRDIKA